VTSAVPLQYRQIFLRQRPDGIPQAEHFGIRTVPTPELGEGQFLVRVHYLSVDPAMRGWLSAAGNYFTPVPIGGVMSSFASGEVMLSRHEGYPVGARLMGMFGWQEYAVCDGSEVKRRIQDADEPLSLSLGILGLNGLTAYFGLMDVGRPIAGDTVVVSTAAGAVGSAVGQIARIQGCRVIGIAGGPEKVRWCKDIGYDFAIDYKQGDLGSRLSALCPDGVNVYFDNTSGEISDAVLPLLAVGARVAVCGTASVSSWSPWPMGPRVARHLLVKRARMQGFLCMDYEARYNEGIIALKSWIKRGRLKHREDILDGLERAPGSIADLYRGDNAGKRLIRLVA
jgi:NADPH-dependent curcumin reductase CurA